MSIVQFDFVKIFVGILSQMSFFWLIITKLSFMNKYI